MGGLISYLRNFRKGKNENQANRIVYINNAEQNRPFKYCSNYISTTKYNAITFLPVCILEQFSRLANAYFLLIGILCGVPAVSPYTGSGAYSTLAALFFVVGVSIVKEGIEDWKRYLNDKDMNSKKTKVLRGDEFVTVRWEEVVVGDIVRVESAQYFPADIIMLSSTGPAGTCYIETANLDGETNLKIKQSVKQTSEIIEPQNLRVLSGEVECEPPNERLYSFSGTITLGGEKIAVGVESMLLRGSMLRNTDAIHGIVVYSGDDTRLMKNQTEKPLKTTSVNRAMNKQLIAMFVILCVLSTFCAIGSRIWRDTGGGSMWYLAWEGTTGSSDDALRIITFALLFCNIVPISLYVSLEMVKVVQCMFIDWDLGMYDEETDTPAKARTSNLNEELGQIQYVLTDKTGTLTRNIMQFVRCTVAGIDYGSEDPGGEDEDSPKTETEPGTPPRIYISNQTNGSSSALNRQSPESSFSSSSKENNSSVSKPSAGFTDPKLLSDLNTGAPHAGMIREFLTILAVCHTVVPEIDPKNPTGKMIYQAASPDEEALVKGARELGFEFKNRTPSTVEILANGTKEIYEILNILEFNSTRKRMSVVVRTPSNELKLFTKGADTMIFARLKSTDVVKDPTEKHLENFAAIGLRTLCISSRSLTEAEYKEWERLYYDASIALVDRDTKVDEVSELIERDLNLVGATAIEDRLQDGVPDTLISLGKAGIKIWVLTGDKQETAINIGFSCGLLDDEHELIILNESIKENAIESLNAALKQWESQATDKKLALVIDGHTLSFMLEENEKRRFMQLGRLMRSVICCRVSPLQKALVVTLVREADLAITLAIGDGANDVGMIQAAHVGVGISGKEGMQAVLASDYAIAQFKFLKRLLLVHGRWSYKRVTRLILYCFYKNVVLTFTFFWFACVSGFSGQTLYDGWFISFYNVAFTSFPIMVMATQDQDTALDMALNHPEIYKFGQQGTAFNLKVFWGWFSLAFLHSIPMLFIPVFMIDSPGPDGTMLGMWAIGTVVFTIVIITVTLKLALTVSSWNWTLHLVTWGSVVCYFAFVAVYSLPAFATLAPDLTYVAIKALGSSAVWLCFFITPIITLLPDFIIKYVRFNYFSTAKTKLIYEAKKERRRMRRKKGGVAVNVSNISKSFREGIRRMTYTGFAFASEPGQAKYIHKQSSTLLSDEVERSDAFVGK